MKKRQHSNTPPLHHSSFPNHDRFRWTTGVDRAALDWALEHNVECGGWCPKGRKAEDGPIDSKYPLKETPTVAYIQGTEWNVRDSDGTIEDWKGGRMEDSKAVKLRVDCSSP